MEKAKVRSVVTTGTERVMLEIVSKIRNQIKGLSIEKGIKTLKILGYPEKEAIKLAFMVKWNRKNNKRLLTLPLFIHTINYVKYNDGKLVDVYEVKYISSTKITQINFDDTDKNKKQNNTQITLDELLETKKVEILNKSKLSYCLDNIYNYRKNEIIEIQTEQIL